MWSIGNEVKERADPELTRMLRDEVKKHDLTRPVTAGINKIHTGTVEISDALDQLDVAGLNYLYKYYESDHLKKPKRIMMGTESFPKDALENFTLAERNPYILGDFVWTAMDYMGETGLGHTFRDNDKPEMILGFPWYQANCGDIDLIGNKKPQSYYRDVVWRRSPVEILVHTPNSGSIKERISLWGWPDELSSWTWDTPKGNLMDVNVYSRGDLVKLELNGKIIGESKNTSDTTITASFQVPYHPGTLKAYSYSNGKLLGIKTLVTANDPIKIIALTDEKRIKADQDNLIYISLSLSDKKGVPVLHKDQELELELSGPCTLLGFGNSNPTDPRSFKQPITKTFRGKALVVLRPTGEKGEVVCMIKGKGLKDETIKVSLF
jgi:beta-galactosidase